MVLYSNSLLRIIRFDNKAIPNCQLMENEKCRIENVFSQFIYALSSVNFVSFRILPVCAQNHACDFSRIVFGKNELHIGDR